MELWKNILAEDSSLEETIKLRLAYEQTDVKLGELDGSKLKGNDLRRVTQEEVKLFNIGALITNKDAKIKCTT